MAVRIVSALVGIVIGLVILLFDNLWVYVVVVSAISALGVWEITRAVKCEEHKPLRFLCVVFSVMVPFFLNISFLKPYAVCAFLLFLLCLFMLQIIQHGKFRFEQLVVCGAAAGLIPAAMSCAIFIRYLTDDSRLGLSMVFYTLFSAWFGDSGAYFVGTFLGKHKLCPNISPKKTVEGLIGGIVTVGVVALIHCLVFNFFIADGAMMSYFVLIPVAMMASGVGVIGDLTASIIKRQYDVKDFGTIMPGHGGVLDRFDSVLFVCPFLYMVFSLISPAM